MDRRRRLAVSAVGLLVAVAVALLAGVAVGHRLHPHPQSKASPPVSSAGIRINSAAGPLSADRAGQMAAQLSAGTDDGLRLAVALPSGQALNPAAAAQIRALGRINVDSTTFHPNPDGTATVTMHVEKPSPGQASIWTANLINVDGLWKISFTDPSS